MSSSSINVNKYIADELNREASSLAGFRGSALRKSAALIKSFPHPITNASQLGGVKGIGEGTIRRVAEILAAGIPTAESPVAKDFDFTRIKFFGDATVRKLHASGIKTLEDLKTQVKNKTLVLNPNQNAGLKYFEDLEQRVPRAEVKKIGDLVLSIAAKYGLKGEIVGSYRRGKQDSGDIDVFITGDVNPIHQIVHEVPGIVYIFSLGEHKFMGVYKESETSIARSLDIRYVHPSHWGAALLFGTGSDNHNVQQRNVAISKGYKLSEYGLFDAAGNLLASTTEEEIFEKLGQPYLAPTERNI